MNRKLFSLLTAGVFALLSSCGDSVVDVNTTPEDPASSPVQTKASLSVVVQDNSTGKPIDGATVSLPLAGKTVTTVDGTAIFDSLTTGSYEVRVSAAEYAPIITETYVGYETAENIYVAQSSKLQVKIYPLTSKISGILHYTDNNGAKQPAAGTTVALIINNGEIADSLTRTTIVGADGKYEFTALPAINNSYRIVALEATLGGTVYGSQQLCYYDCGSLTSNSVTYVNHILSKDNTDELFIVLSYSNYIANTAPVVITFSSPVDLRKINTNTVYLSSSITGADLAWNTTGDELTITPKGKWNSNFQVRFTNSSLRSANNKILDNTDESYYYIIINVNQEDISAKQVSGLKLKNTTVDYTSNSADIEWNKVDGATGYKIYRKTINDNGYVYADETNGVNDTTITTISFGNSYKNYYNYGSGQETNGYVINHDTVSFIVQAYNSSSQTSLAVAEELEIYAKPTLQNESNQKINPYQVVRFGYNDWNGGTQYYSYSASYIYGLEYYDAFGTPYTYQPYDFGLDSAQFGYFSDLAYYLAQTTAYTGNPKNWNGGTSGTGIEDDLIAGCTVFNEPMDTTAELTVTTGLPPTRVTVGTFWSETTVSPNYYYPERTLCYYVRVAAGLASTAAINSTISISGLKSKAGIPLEINYNGIRKSTLDFKIKSIGYVDPS